MAAPTHTAGLTEMPSQPSVQRAEEKHCYYGLFISLQICNGWHLFAFLCGFGKEERIWIQNSYKMAWHGVAWIGLFCLLLLWITFHINFRLWVDVYLVLQSCTPLQLILLFEKEIPRVYLLCIRKQGPVWRLGEMGWWWTWAARGKFSLFKGSPWAGEFQVCSQPCSEKFRQTVVLFLHPWLCFVSPLQPALGVTTLHVPQCSAWAVLGQSMAQPEMGIQSLLRSPVGCSCLQNHQLEYFPLLFFCI